jgi:hypothetical protein
MFKKKSIILTLLLIAFSAFYLTNCEKDNITGSNDNDDNTPSPEVQDLLGKWEVTNIHIVISGIIDTSGAPSDFSSLGIPNQIFVSFFEDSINQAVLIWADSTDTVSGTWSVSGDQLTTSLPLRGEEQVVTGTYVLSEDKNTMTFETIVTVEYPGLGTVQLPVTLTLQKRES